MTTSAPLPKDHPIMIAWERYKSSKQYANAFQWARNVDHRDGSMWNAFLAGYDASYTNRLSPAPVGVMETIQSSALYQCVVCADSYPEGSCHPSDSVWVLGDEILCENCLDSRPESEGAIRVDNVIASHEPAPTDTQEGVSEAGEVLGWSWKWGPEGKRIYDAERPDERQFPGKHHDLTPLVRQSALTACQQEVETLREGIKEIAERERGIRDNWTRFEAETGARTLELETDLEIANDKLRVANEALEPFAEVAFDEHDDLPDNTVVVIKHEKLLDVTFTLGDFRRARAALGGQSNEA